MINRVKISSSIKYILFKLFGKKISIEKVGGYDLKFLVTNKNTFDRSLYFREPETVDWILSFERNEFFWDIGSCTGIYTLLAGKRGINSYAFEVDLLNYNLTRKNIEINDLNNLCNVFNFYVGENNQMINVIANLQDGESNKPLINDKNDNLIPGLSLDDLIKFQNIKLPNHIKIDVERTEDKIFKGANIFFDNVNIKSVMVEISSDNFEFISNFMIKKNFKIKAKFGQGTEDANYLFIREY